MSVKIIIGADIAPTKTNYELFENGDVTKLIGTKLQNILETADFRVFNLEVPLTDTLSPIGKYGPCLVAPTKAVNALKKMQIDFLTLANNHILDQGEQGLKSTMEILKTNGIDYSGVGENVSQASTAYIKEIKGVKLGIYCCAEHEFSIATDNMYGANPFDALESFDHVKKLKSQCDLVVVLYHGGKEHYRYPSPMLQRVFRKFADVGADYVVAQHTHCIGCAEDYKNSKLIYGQGNFLFDGSASEYWKTSMLIEVSFDEENKSHEYKLIPCCKNGNSVRAAEENEAKEILSLFETRSREITKPEFIKSKYSVFAKEMRDDYCSKLFGKYNRNIILRIINKATGYRLWKMIYPVAYSYIIRNCFECEAHRELIIEAMRLQDIEQKV